jgi:hypothetical protein
MVLHDDVGQLESCFGLFGDTINLGARLALVCTECTIGSEIALGTPEGTPS